MDAALYAITRDPGLPSLGWARSLKAKPMLPAVSACRNTRRVKITGSVPLQIWLGNCTP